MKLDLILSLVNFIIKDFGSQAQPISDNNEFSDQLHYAQLKYFKAKLGLPEQYSPGMPLPKQSFEITKRITEDLRQFKVMRGWGETTPIITDNMGYAAYPKDYYYPSVMTYTMRNGKNYEREIEFLSDAEFTKRTTSFSELPNIYFPVVNLQKDRMRFSPKTITFINFIYLRLPIKPYLSVTFDGGFAEYDEANSVELEWNDISVIDIISILLGGIGISIKSGEVINYSEKLKVQGD